MNLLCGVLGVIASLNGRLELGFELMILAAVFDFCDGLAARLLKAYSEIGKELDSLADDVSFGVLPAVMLYQISGTDIWVLKYLPLVLAAFSDHFHRFIRFTDLVTLEINLSFTVNLNF